MTSDQSQSCSSSFEKLYEYSTLGTSQRAPGYRFQCHVPPTSFAAYPEVGATGDGTARPDVSGYTHDHERARLGEGEAIWERARAGLRAWRMMEVDSERWFG